MFSLFWITVGFSVIYSLVVGAQRLSEPERVQQWHDEGHVWPPNWHQESDAFKIAMDKRENDILSIDATQERWENFMQFTQSRMLPRFTSNGFAVVSTPSRVQSRLKTKLDDALFHLDQFPDEGTYAGSYRKKPVKIVDFGRSLDDLQPELKEIHENFVNGMELTLSNVYGIRVNQDGSSLAMHYDQQIESNVISSIIHIAHEYFNDDEPWPIEIEDHDGVLHAVNLEPGQMLIYESAACLHGRRRILKGHYYASLFMHYRPTHPQIWNYTIDDVIARVPPHWKEGTTGLHGSRHAGQALTTDSLISDAAPPRIPSVELDRQLEKRLLATTADTEAVRLAQERANILAGYALPASSEGEYQSTQPWPWPYESTAFQGAMDAREKELFTLTGRDERWDNFMLYTQGRLVRRFTERGFKLLQTPAHIQARLKAEVDRAVENFDQIPDENSGLGAYIKYPNKILDIRQVLSEVHRELHPIMEDWVGGMQLVPTSIYGVRLNREGAALAMHYDKVYTHVISSIVHIAHEYFNDDEPWPIEIEDHDGVLHAVNLEPGQMLLYESSACLHGRRQVLKGRYYASAFSHYQPVDRAVWNYTIQDVVAHVPKYWSDGLLEEHGSRHAGQALTVDSRIADNAPPRVVLGQEVTDIHAFLDKRKSEL